MLLLHFCRMKKYLILILFFIISILTCQAGEGFIFKGHIVDAETGESIAGVEILLKDKSEKVYSDLDGYFEVAATLNQELLINTVSYKETSLQISTPTGGYTTIQLDSK